MALLLCVFNKLPITYVSIQNACYKIKRVTRKMAAPLLNMAGIKAGMLLPITVLLLLVSGASGAKLNAPKVLLPYYSSVIANFTLEVEYSPEESQVTNCYRW